MKKTRLDSLLVEKGLVQTRTRAQRFILAGQVLVNDVPVVKVGQLVDPTAAIRLKHLKEHAYVSRGGLKLAAALQTFPVVVKDRIAMDVGASTGGFTQVLLMQGITRVHAIDVGIHQMDWLIRSDPRVRVQEKINARYLTFDQIGEWIDLIVVDVSFISLEKIIPALFCVAHSQTDWITLVKPQFEAGPNKLDKNGVLQYIEECYRILDRVTHFCNNLGLARLGLIESPITGTAGNREWLLYWKKA